VIPPEAKLRVVGDVHGDARAFAIAVGTTRFVIQLGDLTDGGEDSAGVLMLALGMQESGRGLFLLGNHEHKLARLLSGREVHVDAKLRATVAQLDAPLRARALAAIVRAPAWLRHGHAFFVHGGFHTEMLSHRPPPFGTKPTGALARALFGQITGRRRPDGYPERVLHWVDRIPAGLTVYCGHDNRSTDGRPVVREGAAGGRAVFLDTGAGKGGHLSWIDLPALDG
jgi:Calcineurin-like phosphoesterase